MATAAIRKLDFRVGEIVEIADRNGEVLWLEPAVVTMAEFHERWGTRPASKADFDRLFGDLPTDGEG